jgi:hypothetical protein
MKSNLIFLFLVLTQTLFAQYFTEMTGTPFEGVAESSIAFADVDGDNDQDVLISGAKGLNGVGAGVTKLYTNDGKGRFTEMTNAPFENVRASSIAFADVDRDNDQDALIIGANKSGGRIAKLYINDGTGGFTEMTDNTFEGVTDGSIAFADVDGDNDQDLLITGNNQSYVRISKLYINDGTGSFTEMTGTPFEDVSYGSIAFADVDGDDDKDLLITGSTVGLGRISKLYTNDGTGSFTEMTGTPFEGVRDSSIAFADVDGDNDQDVLITGYTSPLRRISKLYTNDGTGSFTEMTGTPFEGVDNSSIAFADVDGDNDKDVLITGTGSGVRVSKLYTNDGTGSFTLMTATPFEGVSYSSIAFADVDGDNDKDVLITGAKTSETHISKLYTNDSLFSSSIDFFVDVRLNLTPFPNPTKWNNLNISFKSMENNSIIMRVYDLNGHLISQQKEFAGTGEQTFVIDITSLTAGTYFIQLETSKKIGVAKFIVQ